MGCAGSKEAGKIVPVFLPFKDVDPASRTTDLEAVRKEYFWTWAGSATPYVKEVPKREMDHPASEHSKALTVDVLGQVTKLGFNKTVDLATECFRDEGPFDDWSQLFSERELPKVSERWQSDEEFARQRLNGTMGNLIKRIRAIPEKMPLDAAVVQPLLEPHSLTLEKALSEGRVYICDYIKLDGLPSPADRHSCAPIAIFFVDSTDKLMPLAIQLNQKAADGPIFTPLDKPGLWLAAKIHAQVADTAISEMAIHLAQTHLIPEAAYVSMMRQLHPRHPLHQFLEPHFWYTMIINDGGRSNLLLEGHSVPRLYALGYDGVWALLAQEMTTCQWDKEFDMPKQIEDRDIGDLKNYYWRDDTLQLWKIVHDYTVAMVNDIYASDEELSKDTELTAWFKEMQGSPEKQEGCGLLGLPTAADGSIGTRANLALFLAELIYVISAGHAAINNGQYDYMGFVPNKPQTFRLPLPTNKDEDVPMKTIAEALPGFANSTEQIALMHVLSKPTNDVLASYEDQYLAAKPTTKPIIKKFRDELKGMSDDVQKRNKELAIPYPYLDPAQIAQGVAI